MRIDSEMTIKGQEKRFGFPIKLTLKQQRIMWGYIFLFIPLAYLLAVRIFPTILALNMSFREWSILSPIKLWVGLDNFRQLIQDARFWKSLQNTLIIVILAVPIQVILGLGFALLLNQITKLRSLYRLIYFIPFMTVVPAVARVWQWAYAPEVGMVNHILQFFNLPTQPFLLSPNQALYSIIVVIIWQGLGFSIVIMLAGLNQIPKVYYEAAELDGASSWKMLRYITVPLLNNSLVFLSIILTISALQTFTLVFVMSGSAGYGGGHTLGGPLDATRTLVIHIYDYAFRQMEMGYASAMTMVLLVLMLIITYFQIRVMSRRVEF
jgi:multiple sugar transport system permease protein